MPSESELARRLDAASGAAALAPVRAAVAAALANRTVTGSGAAVALLVAHTGHALAVVEDSPVASDDHAALSAMLAAILETAPRHVLGQAMDHLAKVIVGAHLRLPTTVLRGTPSLLTGEWHTEVRTGVPTGTDGAHRGE
jgi:hypothetical protein